MGKSSNFKLAMIVVTREIAVITLAMIAANGEKAATMAVIVAIFGEIAVIA